MKQKILEYLKKNFGKGPIEDLSLILGDRINILNMINPKTVFHPDSEISFRKNHLLNKMSERRRRYLATQTNKRMANTSSSVLFINGILTNLPLAQHQANVLSRVMGEPVELVHNRTEGLVKDLLECTHGRHGLVHDVVVELKSKLQEKLNNAPQVTLVAYSQGAIIASLALSLLSDELTPDQRSKIHYVTFGAGFKDSFMPQYPNTEHFANCDDPITHLGLLNAKFDVSGNLFTRDVRGHYLIADYLLPMEQGVVYGSSQFETRLARSMQ